MRTLRRLIFGKGDTFLVAYTGFGKSLIFHAFSLLTGKITLQIIPLNKLGDEQLGDIKKLTRYKLCLVTTNSKKAERNIIRKITQYTYTHILFGSEQASSKVFCTALKETSFQQHIGLVAIDEYHLVKQ